MDKPLSDQEKRNFAASMLSQFGIEISPEDHMLPVLYLMNRNTREQMEMVQKMNELLKTSGGKYVFNDAKAAEAFSEKLRLSMKNKIEYSLVFLIILAAIGFAAWYFADIRHKYNYIKATEIKQPPPPHSGSSRPVVPDSTGR